MFFWFGAERTILVHSGCCIFRGHLLYFHITKNIHPMTEVTGVLGLRIKGTFVITAPFWCDYGYNIEIGDNFYANHNCIFLDAAKIKLGDNVFIAPNCCFSTATIKHNYEEKFILSE